MHTEEEDDGHLKSLPSPILAAEVAVGPSPCKPQQGPEQNRTIQVVLASSARPKADPAIRVLVQSGCLSQCQKKYSCSDTQRSGPNVRRDQLARARMFGEKHHKA